MSEICSPGSIAGPPATFLGAYNSGTTYAAGDAVSSAGSSYVSLTSGNVGHEPATEPTQWALLAASGSPGEITVAALGLLSRTADWGENQLDLTKQVGFLINNDGSLSSMSDYSTSGFIAALGTRMLCNFNLVGNDRCVACFDPSQNFIGQAKLVGGAALPDPTVAGTLIELPAGTAYVRTSRLPARTPFSAPDMVVFGDSAIPPAMPGSYVSFQRDPSTVVDSKIAAATATITAAYTAALTALGGGLGAVNENRQAQVAIVEGQGISAGDSQTLFSATGAGSVERIQLAFVNAGPSTLHKLTEMEACTLTITVDGTVFTTTVGMFFLNIGISDANPANEVFSTKWLERSLSLEEAKQGLGRRIYIPYQTSCSIVFTAAPTAPMQIYTQVDYYKGAPLPGLHSVNRKVFHMATLEWKDSAGLTPYQQIQLLISAATGPGFLEHWHIAASCDASGIGNIPGWLEANPSIAFDGTTFGAGGTEDFFGTQYYGDGFHPKSDEFSFSLFTSAKTGLTYTLLARHFDKLPIPFTTSLGPVTWSNGQGSQGATPLPALKCGMQIVWYTAS